MPWFFAGLYNNILFFITRSRTFAGNPDRTREPDDWSNSYSFKSFSFREKLKHMNTKAVHYVAPAPPLLSKRESIALDRL